MQSIDLIRDNLKLFLIGRRACITHSVQVVAWRGHF